MSKPVFEIVRGNDLFFFHLTDSTGNYILSSDGFALKAECEKAIATISGSSRLISRIKILQNTSGQYYFNLKLSYGSIQLTSRFFEDENSLQEAVDSLPEYFKNAEHKCLTWA